MLFACSRSAYSIVKSGLFSDLLSFLKLPYTTRHRHHRQAYCMTCWLYCYIRTWSSGTDSQHAQDREGMDGAADKDVMLESTTGSTSTSMLLVKMYITVVSKMINLSHIHFIIKGNQLQEKKYRRQRVSRARLVG